ncbi:MAG: Mth938-like domain-containing protein [Hyphomicrobiaceae bacterium]
MSWSESGATFPGQAPIDAYGNGGFRFAEMSHRGSILCLPEGVFAWDVTSPDQLDMTMLARLLDVLAPPSFVLLGTGPSQVFPSLEVRRAFMDAKIGLEPMDTGAACRTYNVLLAEERPVVAALIAVD